MHVPLLGIMHDFHSPATISHITFQFRSTSKLRTLCFVLVARLNHHYHCIPLSCTTGDRTVSQNIAPRCQQPKDDGPCEGYFVKYYFNTRNLRCEQTVYGGCEGNANRFDSKAECESTCELSGSQLVTRLSYRVVHRFRIFSLLNFPMFVGDYYLVIHIYPPASHDINLK